MKLRFALAQINTTVGDVPGNTQKILEALAAARKQGADLVVFPEQATSGYPAEDLLFKPQFLEANRKAIDEIAPATKGLCAIVGFPEPGDRPSNSAAVFVDGELLGIYRKMHLPNYGVFDEVRYFNPGTKPMVVDLAGRRIGISVCEDIWVSGAPETVEVALGGAHCIVNISASPFFAGKAQSRSDMMAKRAGELNAYVCFTNLVGGQDELVFDGNSQVFDPAGKTIAHAKAFAEDLLFCDLDFSDLADRRPAPSTDGVQVLDASSLTITEKSSITNRVEPSVNGSEEIYKALILGCRDYIHKNGFSKVALGLSGGVDSAITAVIAADALGPENVITLFMPSRYTSDQSGNDAFALAQNLGIVCHTVPIGEVFESYKKSLAPFFEGRPEDVTEENIQARIRGNYLMAFSNKFGYMVLTTGNKSENAVGYATLYGDMAGGFNLIKDLPKVLVYDLCRYRNNLSNKPIIPENILVKAPTAELRPDQKDSDSLPEYDELDPILKLYVEEDCSFEKIVAQGHNPAMVSRVIQLVDRNEYKRRQSSPGIKITPRAFGKDRRLPITNRYRDGNVD
jgi:NAD+ synthase (glutamine-hydrolysing)